MQVRNFLINNNMKNIGTTTYIRKFAKKINIINSLGGCCSECGESRAYLLTFHHIDPSNKKFTIGTSDIRLSSIKNEADKCVVLCRNCHRELHNLENDILNTRPRRMKQAMLEYKKTYACIECGYNKSNSALEFHHINGNDKISEISSLTQYVNEKLTSAAKIELDKCDVLCSNCHHLKHFNVEYFNSKIADILDKVNAIKEVQPKLNHEEIFKLYTESKLRVIDIARKYGASKGTISSILKKYGCTTKMDDLKINRQDVFRLYAEQKTKTEIAKFLNCSNSTITRILK